MIKRIIVTGFSLSLLGTAWAAEAPPHPKQELVGLGSGAALGAAAGPIGVVLGAALGTWLGSRFYAERSARLDFEQRWEIASAQAATLEGQLDASMRRSEQQARTSALRIEGQQQMLRRALEAQVYFRTGDATLAGDTEARLLELGAAIARMDDVAVQVDGYADARGDAAYNEALSAERAEAVRTALLKAGVPAERIHASARGEIDAVAAENDVDALALDRRVRLSIVAPLAEGRAAMTAH
jgi:outer membrane protein OmpA-like peptidoglycan-associated protein